jgi:hypothetical protein
MGTWPPNRLSTMKHTAGDSPETRSGTFMVGELYVDVGQQRVGRAGSDLALPNLSLRLLVALMRAAPDVLSNESLMTQVWPGLVVSPETVNKRVNLLRGALGDDPREPRYIAGVRGRSSDPSTHFRGRGVHGAESLRTGGSLSRGASNPAAIFGILRSPAKARRSPTD